MLGSLALLLVIRFFTEKVAILPNFTAFVDIPILIVLLGAAATRTTDVRVRQATAHSFFFPVVGFLLLCGISAMANSSRVATAPVLLFAYGMVSPVMVYWAVFRLWPAGNALSVSRFLVGLCVLELAIVALYDLPRFFAQANPDVISGTFGTNAYQLVFFVLVIASLVAGIFTFEPGRTAARFAPALLVAIFVVIVLAQYRALIITTVLTIALVGTLLGTARARGVAAGVFGLVSLLLVLSYAASAFPFLKLGGTLGKLYKQPGQYITARLHAADAVDHLFTDHPRYLAYGTGPGTFSSRAWFTFAASDSRSASNTAGPYARKLTGGDIYHTDVSDTYVQPQIREGPVVSGSRAASSPRASYLSVMAEVGLPGLLLLFAMYGRALLSAASMTVATRRTARRGDPLPALLIACSTAFFVLIQLALLDNWLEVTRITFLSWALLAVVTREFTARQDARAR